MEQMNAWLNNDNMRSMELELKQKDDKIFEQGMQMNQLQLEINSYIRQLDEMTNLNVAGGPSGHSYMHKVNASVDGLSTNYNSSMKSTYKYNGDSVPRGRALTTKLSQPMCRPLRSRSRDQSFMLSKHYGGNGKGSDKIYETHEDSQETKASFYRGREG